MVDITTPQDKMPYSVCKNVFTTNIPSDITHRVVLQDDVELAPNFKEYIDKVINTHPDCIVMLTALDFRERNSYGDNLTTPYVEVGSYVSGCALIIPVKYVNKIFHWLDCRYPRIAIGRPHEDFAIREWAKLHNVKVITTVPSLVQHMGMVSTIGDYGTPLQTAYFSDWDKANWESKEIAPSYKKKKGTN